MVDPGTLTVAAAVVSMGSALGIFGYVRSLVKDLRRHERLLLGEPEVDGWDGIVSLARENRQQLEELRDEVRDA